MTSTIDRKTLGAHILRALDQAQRQHRSSTLETLASTLDVRRTDVREVITSLHREGHVDARRMRLTFTGFAIAANLRQCKLADLRSENESATCAA